MICYLCRSKGCDSALFALPAGYLAGLSFLFNPSLGMSIASVTAAAKVYTFFSVRLLILEFYSSSNWHYVFWETNFVSGSLFVIDLTQFDSNKSRILIINTFFYQQLYSTILYEKKILPTNVPLPELLFCLCQGILYHARFMHADVCPGYVFNLMRTVSHET